jgi:hypothetical protein
MAVSDIITTIDLRLSQKKVIIYDNFDYSGGSWNINSAVAVVSVTGPKGVIYENTDFNNPDIIPGTSRTCIRVIYLPLDPETGYTEPLKGNYTVKVSRQSTTSADTEETLVTYSYQFDTPVITNETVSGPYSGTLVSTDTTDYGSNISTFSREHRIKYPTQLSPVPDDIVSSNASVTVSPIYTNQWTIEITTSIEYHNPDTLRLLYEGSASFTHCVYGGCISAMYDAISTMLSNYQDIVSSNIGNKDAYERRLVTANTAWHLLNVAYQGGDVVEADKQSAIIHEQVAYTGSGICGGSTSEEVVPCPAYSGGGGTTGSYTFENALTLSTETVRLGGALTQNTAITVGAYEYSISGASSGKSVSQSIDVNNFDNKISSSSYESRVLMEASKITFENYDIGTPANSKGYEVGSDGIVEKGDYSASYALRTLVAKGYVVDNFLATADGTLNSLTNKPPVDNDIILIEDSENSYSQKKATISSIRGVTSLIGLTDTFSSYTGLAGEVLVVSDTEDGVETLDLDTNYVNVSVSGQIESVTEKATPAGADLLLIEDSEDTFSKKKVSISNLPISLSFIGLSDSPNTYTGAGGYFVKVKSSEDGIEFVSDSGFVPTGGGEFTGPVTIKTSNDYPLVLRQSGAGSVTGTAEAGTNQIKFEDDAGDVQGYIGIDSSGNVFLRTLVSGGVVYVQGDIGLSGKVDGVDIAAFKTAFDAHTHAFSDLESVPTTLSGYGITDAVSSDSNDFTTSFTEKTAGVIGDYVLIEDSENGYEKKYVQLGNIPPSSQNILSLTDTPTSYSGAGDYFLKVTSAENGVEFTDIAGMYLPTADGTINALSEKANPITNDVILIEDSEDTYSQKKIPLTRLLQGSNKDGNFVGSDLTSNKITLYHNLGKLPNLFALYKNGVLVSYQNLVVDTEDSTDHIILTVLEPHSSSDSFNYIFS